MSKTDLQIDDHVSRMDAVVSEYLKGYSISDIAKTLRIPTGQVGKYLKDWRELAANNEAIKSRATLALRNADKHYDDLVRSAHEALSEAESFGSINMRLNAIRTIADLEKTRIDMLQKAGLLENDDISQQMVETERKQQVLMDILKTTVGPCDRCRPIVQERLAEVSKGPVIINVE